LRAKKPIRSCVITSYVRTVACWGEIIDGEEHVFRAESQPLVCVSGADPRPWEVTRIEASSEVLLRKRREYGLARTSWSGNKEGVVTRPLDGAPDGRVGGEGRTVRPNIKKL